MTERLSEISHRIHSVEQLESVVAAMRAIAAARAQQSRGLLPGIRAYARVIAQAIAQALRLLPEDHTYTGKPRLDRSGLILFAAEQGFAGAFTDRMLQAAGPLLTQSDIFFIGTRGATVTEEREVRIAWKTSAALRVDGAPAVASRICDALYERLPGANLTRVELIFPTWIPGTGLAAQSRSLLPLDRQVFAELPPGDTPLITLPPAVLLERLAEEYVYAQLCEAAMEAFVAENEARVASMAAAKSNIEQMLMQLLARERQVRQEEITAEVVELASSAALVQQ